MKSLIKKIHQYLLSDVARKSDIEYLYHQVIGLHQVQNAMEGRPVLRPMRGWAISPDAMVWILADLQERDSPTVIEFGSGQSTVILAAALKHCGGRLLSVEHDAIYLEDVRRQLDGYGLSKIVEFIHAPLKSTNDTPAVTSYDISTVPETKVDIALIDGPPRSHDVFTRYVPLRWSASHLSSSGKIFLDDANRPQEKDCINRLIEAYPEFKIKHIATEKGLAEFTLSA